MKKIIIIFCGFLLLGCNKNEPTENKVKNNTIFYEDETVMSDLSKEIRYVDSVYSAALKTPLTKSVSKGEFMPMSKDQLVHFLKCMHVCSKSNGNLLTVFVNKKNNCILSVNENPYIPNKNIINKNQLFDLLKKNEIDFKIIKKTKPYSLSLHSSKVDKLCTSRDHIVRKRLYLSYDSFMVYGNLYVEVEVEYKMYDVNTCDSQIHLPDISNFRQYTGTCIGTYESTGWHLGDPLLTIITKGIWTIPIDLIATELHLKYMITTTSYLENENSTLSTSLDYVWI